EMGIARWGMGDPEWPKTAVAFGGKFVYDDDQETPNTLTASFDFGGRQLVFEVRGLPTNAEGSNGRVVSVSGAGGGRGRGRGGPGGPGGAPAGAPSETAAAPPAQGPTPPAVSTINVMVGDLFYGTEGWAECSDEGFRAYKGESSELIMQEARGGD